MLKCVRRWKPLASDHLPVVAGYFLPALGLAGDYNSDGKVDAADYGVWQDTIGSSADLRADGNGNGMVGPEDYSAWANNFDGAATASIQVASVPEPGAPAMLLAVAIALFTAAEKCSRCGGVVDRR